MNTCRAISWANEEYQYIVCPSLAVPHIQSRVHYVEIAQVLVHYDSFGNKPYEYVMTHLYELVVWFPFDTIQMPEAGTVVQL